MQITSVAICLASSAWADARADARHHFEAGMALIAAGRYDDGVAELLEAYSMRPHRDVLFNIAKAYESAGRPTDAVTYYRRYLETNPGDASEVRKEMEKLEARQPKPQAAPQVGDCDGSSGELALPESCKLAPLCVSGSCALRDITFTPVAPDVRAVVTPRPAVLPWKPWAVAAGVVLAAAVVCGILSNTLFDQARTRHFASDAAARLELSHGMAVGADVGFGLGGGLGILSLVLLLAGAPQ